MAYLSKSYVSMVIFASLYHSCQPTPPSKDIHFFYKEVASFPNISPDSVEAIFGASYLHLYLKTDWTFVITDAVSPIPNSHRKDAYGNQLVLAQPRLTGNWTIEDDFWVLKVDSSSLNYIPDFFPQKCSTKSQYQVKSSQIKLNSTLDTFFLGANCYPCQREKGIRLRPISTSK